MSVKERLPLKSKQAVGENTVGGHRGKVFPGGSPTADRDAPSGVSGATTLTTLTEGFSSTNITDFISGRYGHGWVSLPRLTFSVSRPNICVLSLKQNDIKQGKKKGIRK